jgi:uncharacterized repeat protein (TIGR01451 family)
MRTLFILLFLFAHSVTYGSTLTLSYDTAGRLVNINAGGNTNIALSYDNNGNLLSLSSFVSGNPDLAITQSANPSPVLVNKPLTFTVTVFNNSTTAATTTKLTNTMPANVTFLSNSVSQGTVTRSGSILNWAVGKITNANSATLTFTVKPLAIGSLTNKVTVISSVTDPYAADNLDLFVTEVVGPPAAVAGGVADGRFAIQWPLAGGEGFSVQYADSISPPVNWISLPIDPIIFGDTFLVKDSVTNTHRFYRLVSP